MFLQIQINDKKIPVEVPEDILEEADGFFAKLDKDMDGGWQMSREWVGSPNTLQRCQIVADRLLSALHTGNSSMVRLASAYIVKRMKDVHTVTIDTNGEMMQTTFSHKKA